jgi:tryptophan synthase alpha chain
MKGNRIDNKFEELKAKGEKALVGFVTAGDPDRKRSLEVVEAMCRAGMDILELGVPFSDPTADGPVIQKASTRALAAGMSLAGVLEMTATVRRFTDIPIILFSYYNPIHRLGAATFYSRAVKAGADGVLLVDLPPEESRELTAAWPGDELALIRLLAPTTPDERMKFIGDGAQGFLYLVSKTGVTGSDGLALDTVVHNVARVRRASSLPVCVGFGISTTEDVTAIAAQADGVVIGSAFEREIEANLYNPRLAEVLGTQTEAYKAATLTGSELPDFNSNGRSHLRSQ